jgi:hypothetical protein
MKSITKFLGIFAATASLGSASGQSLPLVTFEWSVRDRLGWCNCGEGNCVRPGGLCISEHTYRVASDGTVQNLGSCPGPPLGLGELVVSSHTVTFTGSYVDANALGICRAGCCPDLTCCFPGPLEPYVFTLTFSRPVWFGWGNGQTGSNGMTTAPETSTYIFNQGLFNLGYTSERADFDADGFVDGADLGRLLDAWMVCVGGNCAWAARMDLNDSGQVDGADLGLLLARWGQVP